MNFSLSPSIVLIAAGLLAGCAPEAPVDGVDAQDRSEDQGVGESSLTKSEKVDICHYNGTGGYNVLSVGASAVNAHLVNHGDHYAGTFFADVDGDGEGDPGVTGECLNSGFVENGDDCDDGDAAVSTSAEEVCGDEIDNDCDGDVDEDCTVTVELNTAGDNAVWVWLDGAPVTLSYNIPNWHEARTATFELDSGTDHALAFYVEDWGGLAYFAASVRVDGVVVAATGDGDFAVKGQLLSYGNTYARESGWPNQPASAADSPNLLFSPGNTWDDWMLAGFDDSSWSGDTNTCTNPGNWNATYFAAVYASFADLGADGAEFVWPQFGYMPAGYCYSSGWAGAAYRVELAL